MGSSDSPAGSQTPGRDYYRNVRHELTPFLPSRYIKVLDVGCGEGVSAQLLKLPCETWGVEPDLESAERAAEHLNHVLVGTFEEVRDRLPTGFFDLVFCNDVIEHVPDPDGFLAALKPHLKPGGHIVASIPNMRHWQVLWQLLVRKDWKYGREGILDRTHLKFFTERSIRRLFEEAGFEVVLFQGINGVFGTARRLIMRCLTLVTLGYYGDIEYRQFALQARLPTS